VDLSGDPPANATIGGDGSLWAPAEHGPARFDGAGWTFPYETLGLPAMDLGVAPDGTLFAVGPAVLRLPDRAG
jgi:hypothetical protein